MTQFGYLSFLLSACNVGVPLPALDSKQINNLISLSRTLVNVVGEYFANEIVQSCGKGYETEVTRIGKNLKVISTMKLGNLMNCVKPQALTPTHSSSPQDMYKTVI